MGLRGAHFVIGIYLHCKNILLEHYIKVGITNSPIIYGSTWAEIEANVIDYTIAPASNTKKSAAGEVYISLSKTIYGFAQVEPDGLCYPAGGPDDWPGTWPASDIALTLNPTSHSIVCNISNLSYSYTHRRNYIWYLDGVEVKRTFSEGQITSYPTYTIDHVYFGSAHKIKVEIWNETNTVMFLGE